MPNDDAQFNRFSIKVDGMVLTDVVMNYLDCIEVEDDLAQPAMFILRFHDPDFTLMDGTVFKLGSEVTITAHNEKNTAKVLLVAEITSLEPILDQWVSLYVIRGYDLSHRLYRGHKTRTFLKQTDSQIASKIAGEAGFSAQVQPTSDQHEYVIQHNQTDMDFLRARAARIGYRVLVDGKKLVYRQAETNPPPASSLAWGADLISFRCRMSAVAQANTVEVRGWNPTTKAPLVGKASTVVAPFKGGDGKSGGQAAQTAFSTAATVMVTHQPVETQSEANKLAQSVLDQIAGDYVSAEGECFGAPTVKAGTQVDITGAGKRLSTKYFVTASRHTFTNESGYRTSFTVNGRRPQSLLAAVGTTNGHQCIQGVVIGIVTNNKDPDGMERVKVKYPWLDNENESNWARVASPGAGATRGLLMTPEVNDEVLVAFEHGDMNRPYVVGGLWNGKDKPQRVAAKNGKVEFRSLKTRVGHEIMLQDGEGAGKGLIELKTAGGHLVTISDTAKSIQIKSQAHTILLDDQGRAVKITSGGDVEISGPGGKLKIAAGGVELTSVSAMKVQANAKLELSANAMVDLKSSGILNVQGSLVKIN